MHRNLTRKPNKLVTLFEIRLTTCENGVVLLKGPSDEAPSVLISGNIVLSISEPLTYKNLELGIYGTLHINENNPDATKINATKHANYDKIVYEKVWEDLKLPDGGMQCCQGYKMEGAKSKSSPNLFSLGRSTRSTRSHINLNIFHGGSKSLPEGNYEIPFSAILPGSLTESVEGPRNASLTYCIVARLERGKFYNCIACKRHIRVIRTPTPDALELSETVSVVNTWPGKVDYMISIPSKAVAIGSNIPFNILLVPLQKGLKLSSIKATVTEHIYCDAPGISRWNEDREVVKAKFKNLSKKATENGDEEEYQDHWDINDTISLPASLAKCTQDCNILKHIKVRHTLIFIVSLLNPEGYVSELRATLPIQCFISPYVALEAPEASYPKRHSASHICMEANDDVLFSNAEFSPLSMAMLNGYNVGFLTPPNYGSHIYDKLWRNTSEYGSPPASGIPTPSTADFHHSQDGIDILHLQNGLRTLEAQMHYSDIHSSCSASATSLTHCSRDNVNTLPQHSYENTNHICFSPERRNSLTVDETPLNTTSDYMNTITSPITTIECGLNPIIEVPPYEVAIKSTLVGNELPPEYKPAD